VPLFGLVCIGLDPHDFPPVLRHAATVRAVVQLSRPCRPDRACDYSPLSPIGEGLGFTRGGESHGGPIRELEQYCYKGNLGESLRNQIVLATALSRYR
jgi:hypothetical protein